MAYIEAHQSLLTHRKTLRLVRLLGIDKYGIAGRLVALWHWAIDNAPDGDLGADCADILSEVMGWDADPECLMDALTQVGYVDRAENGSYLLHDWWDYAGRLIEKRIANAERMRDARASKRRETGEPDSAHGSRTYDERATHVQRTFTARAGANVPYRTVPNTTVAEDTDDSRERSISTFVPAAGADVDAQSGDALSERKRRDSEPLPADSEAMRLATLLRDRIRAHTPNARVPATSARLQPWATVFDLMLRLDRRAPPDVEAVIAFATSDTFWRANILSAGKLREKYDQLNIKRTQERQKATQNGHRPVTAATASRPILTADDVYPD